MTNSSVRQDRVAANGEQKGSLKGGQPVLPRRGFPVGEFEARLSRAQAFLRRDRLDALLVTSPQQVRYFTGFDSQFWESPTRPWYVVVPRDGMPIAVIPEIGASGMHATWLRDIRTWAAPNPQDDGVSLLASTLGRGRRHRRNCRRRARARAPPANARGRVQRGGSAGWCGICRRFLDHSKLPSR